MSTTTTKKTQLSEKELLKEAATWNVTKTGRHRQEDGTVPGWHEWSQRHSQKDDPVFVCRGRDEWAKQSNNHLSIVSWNVLSDTWFRQGSYHHTLEEEGEWSFRLGLLMQWIDSLTPDILALQEVDYDKFDQDLLPEFNKRGYDGRMQNPKNKAEKQPCGVATFWKRQTFQLEKQASFSRTLCVVLRGPNTSQLICVANVHLESSQSKEGAECRARQLNSALKFAANKGALVVCGDCNTGADAQLFRVLRDHSWHGHALSSVYEHADTHKTLPVSVATFLVPGHHYVIDHMLYDPETLRLRCALDALSQEEMEEHVRDDKCGFPSALLPSDHIPIGAMFELLPQTAPVVEKQVVQVVLSQEREEELSTNWESFHRDHCPPHMYARGKPTEEEKAERQAFSARVDAWKETMVRNSEERDFVARLVNATKKRQKRQK